MSESDTTKPEMAMSDYDLFGTYQGQGLPGLRPMQDMCLSRPDQIQPQNLAEFYTDLGQTIRELEERLAKLKNQPGEDAEALMARKWAVHTQIAHIREAHRKAIQSRIARTRQVKR